jgi:hypothetical protein
MKRLLVLCVAALIIASAADASDRGYGARSADPGDQYAAQYATQYVPWRQRGHHGWGVVRHQRCVVPDVCASGYYAYGHWTGQPKTACPCESGGSRY